MTLITQMQDAGTAANDPLLSYAITTTPSPLKASPENPQAPEETGELVISVARQSATPADVEKIRVKVPAGTRAPDLATDLNRINHRISLDGWSVHLDATAKEFVCTPTGSHAPIGPDTGFTIQLSDIPVNRQVGTAPITITEHSREGNSGAFPERRTVFNIGKFPADFYLRNFLCEPSIIPNGGDVKLTWERSANATYTLLYPGVERDVTNRTTLDIEGIASDTTFYLRATTGDPTNPVTRILSTQTTVLKPDLEVNSLIVHNRFAVQAQRIASISGPFGAEAADGHPPELMLDGNRETYFLTAHPVRELLVTLDLGREQLVTGVHVYFGNNDGQYIAPSRSHLQRPVAGGGDGRVTLHSSWQPTLEWHYEPTTELRTRYLYLSFTPAQANEDALAIRSVEIDPAPPSVVIFAKNAAEFHVPLHTND
ncbi:hypothetical protein [Streptomyces leeuwenhoekii]|uniref:Uncharacterized protein n=1 Tax=Streptomyces leeuwenhoekii TaxID=1437453 RepID=A0A0F7VKQ8_STRLW|nr:hypothetical protein [Streptomyces leeuwenhoekii]CQR59529.1 Hypothetical Protein sle_00670 [Streptomyces leeuwenhoekii]